MAPAESLIDPQVSKIKFEREIANYRKLGLEHAKRGWFLVDAEFPEVFVVFAASHLQPAIVTFGALINFNNYDFWPPSVKIVDPFTREPYLAANNPFPLLRFFPNRQPESLLASDSPDSTPFFCIPGVREYHSHAAHTGDSWLLHRDSPEGTLFFILGNLYEYGVKILRGFNFQLDVRVSGLKVGGP